jgi:hypothetical protein
VGVMTEKQFDDFVKREMRDYNRPHEVPTEEMWSAIAAARERRRAHAGSQVRHIMFASPAIRWGLGLAATLLVGIGIGLNLDGLTTRSAPEEAVSAGVEGTDAGGDVYQYATWEHLGRAETFLTMFRADVRAGRNDYVDGNPVRDLLTTTRLLQASRAYEDARFRDLLDDLELVLMQIAQLKAGEDLLEADLVEQGMEQNEVLLKLRAAATAGPVPTGIQGAL